MVHTKFHLISPGYSQPSLDLKLENHGQLYHLYKKESVAKEMAL